MKTLPALLLAFLVPASFIHAAEIEPADEQKELRELSQEANFVIFNRVSDFSGSTKLITGVYIIPRTGQPLRDNPEIAWGENLLDKPIQFGDFAIFSIDTAEREWFDWRVDIEGVDTEGKPLQYFHPSSHLFAEGTVVHHAVVSTTDGASPWTMSTKIDPDFAGPRD